VTVSFELLPAIVVLGPTWKFFTKFDVDIYNLFIFIFYWPLQQNRVQEEGATSTHQNTQKSTSEGHRS
jgi:hypothetical protein